MAKRHFLSQFWLLQRNPVPDPRRTGAIRRAAMRFQVGGKLLHPLFGEIVQKHYYTPMKGAMGTLYCGRGDYRVASNRQ